MSAPFASPIAPQEDVRVAIDRMRILDDIVRASSGARSLGELLNGVGASVCARYPGVYCCVVTYSRDGARIDTELPGVRGDIDRDALMAQAWLDEPDRGGGPVLRGLGAVPVVVIPVAGAQGPDRALVFADPADVVAISRGVMLAIAKDCAYVLRREIERHRLAEREAQFRAVFDASPIPQALLLEGDRAQMSVNDALCAMVGYSREALVGSSSPVASFGEDQATVLAAVDAAAQDPARQRMVSQRLIHSSGAVIYSETTLTWIEVPGGPRTLLMQLQDRTAQRRAEQELLRNSEIDSLTGLANRLRLVRELSDIDAGGADFAVLFLDVDRFKAINESRGHDVGDEVLIEVARRLADVAGERDLVARFGGDEFAVLHRPASAELVQASTAAGARELADRIQFALAEPIVTADGVANITVSIGICDDTIPVRRALDRLQYADTAAYQAKRRGEDRQVVYDSGLHQQSTGYRRIESLLRSALDDDRFVMHYQPIVDITDGRAVGVEALVRLRDLAGQLVPPGDFIEVAERSGLIVPLGSWVLAESCRTIAELHRTHGFPPNVSVNVAARQAGRPDLVDAVDHALAISELPPDALTLELTESALLEADSSTLARLNDLRERGVQIALDDFGTGYSSLTYLRQLPVTRIKVDRSFVATMTADPANAAIVRAVTTLAGDLGLTWVAEGVETAEQWAALREMGPGFAQGYHFARPQPADELAQARARLVRHKSACD